MPGVLKGLDELKSMGFRLIIVSSRPVNPIKQWLKKYNMGHYFDDVTNIKHPARYYIDDHAVRFEKDDPSSWENVVKFIKYKEEK
jgi:phosphoglycolate phosphatase-like HAD superfamily hydrolase